MIEQRNNEIVVYCNKENTLDREVLMFAQNHFRSVREIDLQMYVPTGTRFMEIIDHLGITLPEIINKHSPLYPQYENLIAEMDDRSLIQILQHNPDLIHTPIVITKHKGALIKSLSQIIEFVDTKTAEVI